MKTYRHVTGKIVLLGIGKLLWFVVLACAACIWITDAVCQDKNRARVSILLATGMHGSTYYHVGLAMASLWTTRLRDAGIRVSAASSEGSMENIEAIRIADADMIIAEDLFCSMAAAGNGLFKGKPLPELRSITALWPDVLQIVIRSDKMHKGTLQDLDGIALATGLPDSGNKYILELLLKSMKNEKPKVRFRPMSNQAAVEALKKGLVDGIDVTGGVPVPLLSSLLQDGKISLGFLEISGAQMEAAREEGWKNVFPTVVPAGSYPGQDKAIHTVGHANLLAVTASLSPEIVYLLTKTLYENLEYLMKVHPACRTMSLEKALDGVNVPLHRGSVRYYKEKKIKVPERLIQ
ncbi:TAXI family TRAP transporter solute-binding subunit [Desulfomonile tiedjei]|uniref:TAXI family TRAP transporter solute-binding subunit n=1 Tax=Desulfomonile tiedjei TaxID=2358 RepID=UPI000A06D63B|nr:TAXI family TRAP transporter solute-binding subunit [Desulfomonile tiedjei]